MSRHFAIIFAAVFLSLAGCSSSDKMENTPEALFKRAQELEEDERFDEALSKYEELRNRFPYSKLSTESELRAAEIYFKREDFSVAATAYSNFRELHPNHPSMSYVIYKIGISYFNDLPSTIDRDISGARNAIREFDSLIQKYPNFDKLNDAKEKRSKSLEMLAEKELYVADFYFTREQYLSSLRRYEALMKMESSDHLKRQAYLRAGNSALEIGERTKAKEYFDTLVQRFPNSEEADKATSALKSNGLL